MQRTGDIITSVANGSVKRRRRRGIRDDGQQPEGMTDADDRWLPVYSFDKPDHDERLQRLEKTEGQEAVTVDGFSEIWAIRFTAQNKPNGQIRQAIRKEADRRIRLRLSESDLLIEVVDALLGTIQSVKQISRYTKQKDIDLPLDPAVVPDTDLITNALDVRNSENLIAFGDDQKRIKDYCRDLIQTFNTNTSVLPNLDTDETSVGAGDGWPIFA